MSTYRIAMTETVTYVLELTTDELADLGVRGIDTASSVENALDEIDATEGGDADIIGRLSDSWNLDVDDRTFIVARLP